MFKSNNVFTYIDSASGVNQDGEKYCAINVMSKGTHKKKLSFIARDEELINKILQTKFIDFQDISLTVKFDRKYIAEKKFSYWDCELVDIGNTRSN